MVMSCLSTPVYVYACVCAYAYIHIRVGIMTHHDFNKVLSTEFRESPSSRQSHAAMLISVTDQDVARAEADMATAMDVDLSRVEREIGT